MSREKELVKNTGILFLGKVFTQFLSFFLIPLYTNFLSTNSYGYIDLLQTYITILIPIITLRFDSSIFRYLVESRNKKGDKSIIISSTFYIIIFQLLLFITISWLLCLFFNVKYGLTIIINVCILSLSSISLQICRGNGNMNNYAVASIICGIVTTLLNVIFIGLFRFDASYILISSSIGNVFCILYVFFVEKVFNFIHIKDFKRKKLKEMLKYSIPLIPDGMSWWIVTVSDRTIISLFLDVSYNGIYSIACKFSNILATFFVIFNLTWQENASVHVNDIDRDDYFSSVFNYTFRIFSSVCLIIIALIPFIYSFMIGSEYQSSYVYIPILLLGNIFNAMSTVVGGIYIANKETKQVAKTTMLGAIVNIIINILLIKKFGLYAAAISTTISYFIVFIYI